MTIDPRALAFLLCITPFAVCFCLAAWLCHIAPVDPTSEETHVSNN